MCTGCGVLEMHYRDLIKTKSSKKEPENQLPCMILTHIFWSIVLSSLMSSKNKWSAMSGFKVFNVADEIYRETR